MIGKIIKFVLFLSLLILAGIGAYSLYYNYYNDKASYPQAQEFQGIDLYTSKYIKNTVMFQQIGNEVRIPETYSTNIAYTKSMIPTMYGGNTILYKPYPYYKEEGIDGSCPDLKEGMIAVYVEGDVYKTNIVHRIINASVGDGMVQFKGDNAYASDYVRCNQVYSIVVGVLYT